MNELNLSAEQAAARETFRIWVDEHIVPFADAHDFDQQTPPEMIQKLAQANLLGALVPTEYGGKAMDALTWGLLCEEVGRGSASLLSLLTVQSMMIQTLVKWGTAQQKTMWLPRLATGQTIGGFALTEPNIGSDARNIESTATLNEDGTYTLVAEKKWISFGQSADIYLLFAKVGEQPAAFLVERESPNFAVDPIKGMMGFRSANLANLRLDHVVVPAENMVGRPGFGFSHMASTALDQGRYCIAWGCVGLARASVEASLNYAGARQQFGKPLIEHQLIQQMVTDMMVKTKAARLLCMDAAWLKMNGEPSLIMETSAAKYYASRVAVEAANDAVQIHGANGFSSAYPVQRYFRDAKVMEIIEGSTQMQQMIIARSGFQQHQMTQRERQTNT
jgi:glutaryl-CoA dehydrogenase (non-decarboxylating)